MTVVILVDLRAAAQRIFHLLLSVTTTRIFFSYMVRSLFDSEIFAIHNPDQDECPPLGPKSYL